MKNIHFKMETLQHAISSMGKDCFFASVDLLEAFYSFQIRIQENILGLFMLVKNINSHA